MESRKFCVYEHWRADKGECFYVGKGTLKRASSAIRRENPHYMRIVQKLQSLGLSVEVRIYQQGLSESDAFALEIDRIAFWRTSGVNLANLTDGGEGASGFKSSNEKKLKISKALLGVEKPSLRGVPLSDEHKAKISASNKGRVVSEETRKKISDAQKGKPRPELIGRKMNPESIKKLQNREFTQEHRQKISSANKGKIRSEDAKRKISESLKKFHQSKMEEVNV